LLAAPAFAQWPTYASKSVPHKKDGTVNADAPAPRTKDGHPDFTGLWERVGPGGANPNFDALQSTDGGPPAATFWNIGAGVRGGLPFRPLAAQLRDERMADNQKNNPDAHCLPMGLTQLHLHPQPRKLVQTPGLIVIMYEGNEGLRQIFTDGRAVPELNEDLQPWWYGYSAGHWEGDTLVVETTNFKQRSAYRNADADTLRLVERFRRTSADQVEWSVTVEDPATWAKPWTFAMPLTRNEDEAVELYECHEGNHAIFNILGAARAAEREQAASQSR
jgi:hypothetical protein